MTLDDIKTAVTDTARRLVEISRQARDLTRVETLAEFLASGMWPDTTKFEMWAGSLHFNREDRSYTQADVDRAQRAFVGWDVYLTDSGHTLLIVPPDVSD